MASNMTKYATANCNICKSARTACCKILGRNFCAAPATHAAEEVVVVPDVLPALLSEETEDAVAPREPSDLV